MNKFACIPPRLTSSAFALNCMIVLSSPGLAQTPVSQPEEKQPAPVGTDNGADDAQESSAEEIIVTGTNISGVKPVGSQAVVISRKDAEKTGLNNAADVVNTLPQVRVVGDAREGNTGAILSNGGQNTGINIRGLGTDGTLILIDGRRIVGTGTNLTVTNANQLPISALDRIEVITDGTSAVYGSDAVAGVVNYVIRKDFEGFEASFRASDSSGPLQLQTDLTGGINWNFGGRAGNLLATFQYAHRDNYLAADNPRLRFNTAPFGGPDNRLSRDFAFPGFAPNIIVQATPTNGLPPLNPSIPRALDYTYYGVPNGTNVGLPLSALRFNDPNLVDAAYYTDYVGEERKYSVAAFFNQEIADGVEIFLQGNYLNRKVLTQSAVGLGGQVNVDLPSTLPGGSTNPYYIFNVPGVSQGSPAFVIPPFTPPLNLPFPIPVPAQPAAPLKVQYAVFKDGVRDFRATDKSYNITGGIRAELPADWKAEAYYTFGRNSGCTFCSEGILNAVALQQQVNIGAINPLSTEPLTPAQQATVYGDQTQIGHNGLDDIVVKFDGPLVDLPGGTVRAAFGGERNKSFAWNENSGFTGPNNTLEIFTTEESSRYSRTVWSAFGELYFPLVSEEMTIPLVRRFVLSGAVRYDHYSDAGESTNPKIGFDWEVNDVLKFAGSWGTSYHAPSLAYKNPDAYSSGAIQPFPNSDPRVQKDVFGLFSTTAFIFGANPELKPESANTWSLTGELDLRPVRFSATYYNISYKDRITFPGIFAPFLLGQDVPNYFGYSSFAIPVNNPVSCRDGIGDAGPPDPASADPALQPYLGNNYLYSPTSGVSAGGGLSDFCSIRVLLDSRFFNLARAKQQGLDINASFDRTFGELTVNSAVTVNYLISNKEQAVAGQAFRKRMNTFDTPVRWRGRGNVGVFYHGVSATLFGNFYGSYKNDLAVDSMGNLITTPVKVPSHMTFDLTLGYDTTFERPAGGLLKGLRSAFTIINLFDNPPPVVITANSSGSNSGTYNPAGGIPFGRRFAFQVTGLF